MKIPNKSEIQQLASNYLCDIEFKDFMKFWKYYTKEPYLFLVDDTTFSSNKPFRFGKNLGISEKIKAIDNKIKQNKAQYNLDRQIAKIFTLSSGNVNEYEFLTDQDVLSENKSCCNQNVWMLSVRKSFWKKN